MIVVMVDDLGAMDERVLERLPNIRALWLNKGLRFNDAYSETPLCCPGRAAFLTGQHTRRHGVVVNDVRLLDPRHTIATALDDAGYFTVMSGKYLNGVANITDHTPPGWDRVAMLNSWNRGISSEWWIQDVPYSGGYFDRVATDLAVDWLTGAPSDEPLFMWLTPHAPHKSEAARDAWIPDVEVRYASDPRCDDIRPWEPGSYSLASRPGGFPLEQICRSLLTVDDMVGQVRDEVARQGRDPIWVFTADNGMAWGAHGYALKNVPYADRLPLYFAGPGIVSGATSALVSNIDLAPTLADLAGVTMPRADGRSFARVLRGDGGGRRAMLQDHPVGGPTGRGDLTGPWWGIRTRQWHLVVWNGTHLYRTDLDRWEMDDVAVENPEMTLRLARMWGRLIGEHGPAEPPFPANPVPTPTPLPTASPGGPTPTSEPTPTLGPTPPAEPTASAPTDTPTPTPAVSPIPHETPDAVLTASPTTAMATVAPTQSGSSAVPPAATPTALPIGPITPDAGSSSASMVIVLGALLGLAGALSVPALRKRLR